MTNTSTGCRGGPGRSALQSVSRSRTDWAAIARVSAEHCGSARLVLGGWQLRCGAPWSYHAPAVQSFTFRYSILYVQCFSVGPDVCLIWLNFASDVCANPIALLQEAFRHVVGAKARDALCSALLFLVASPRPPLADA